MVSVSENGTALLEPTFSWKRQAVNKARHEMHSDDIMWREEDKIAEHDRGMGEHWRALLGGV